MASRTFVRLFALLVVATLSFSGKSQIYPDNYSRQYLKKQVFSSTVKFESLSEFNTFTYHSDVLGDLLSDYQNNLLKLPERIIVETDRSFTDADAGNLLVKTITGIRELRLTNDLAWFGNSQDKAALTWLNNETSQGYFLIHGTSVNARS